MISGPIARQIPIQGVGRQGCAPPRGSSGGVSCCLRPLMLRYGESLESTWMNHLETCRYWIYVINDIIIYILYVASKKINMDESQIYNFACGNLTVLSLSTIYLWGVAIHRIQGMQDVPVILDDQINYILSYFFAIYIYMVLYGNESPNGHYYLH